MGITRNSTLLSTIYYATNKVDIMAAAKNEAAGENQTHSPTATVVANVGDIFRPHVSNSDAVSTQSNSCMATLRSI